jgi:uncharacterized spore protein YtfJ
MTAVAERVTDALSARQVFGEPIERRGVTVVPVATVAGGGGGDASGSGFGGVARPTGVFVIEGGTVRWIPAVDATKLLAVVGVAVAAVLLLRAVRRQRAAKQEEAQR